MSNMIIITIQLEHVQIFTITIEKNIVKKNKYYMIISFVELSI